MRLVSLFSGAGGLDIGLELAGFETASTIDIDSDSVATLRASQLARLPGFGVRSLLEDTNIIEADIASADGADLDRGKDVDLLAGGPPCQPFSSSGRQRGLDDPRGRLWEHFLRIAAEIRPKIIVLENVRGIVTARGPEGRPGGAIAIVRREFEALGYGTAFALLNAADYGAAQRRVRLFMIASRCSPLPSFPEPTHLRADGETLPLGMKPWVPLQEVIDGLPTPPEADIVRPNDNMSAQLRALSPGTGIKVRGIVEANRPGGHWGYRQDGFLADPMLPARTIRAASTPDWLRLPDGTHRRLTWRECAALQGFPRDWRWQGKTTSRFKQIGNAVQVDVARAIGESLREALGASRNEVPDSRSWPPSFTKAMAYTAMEARVNAESRIRRLRIDS